MSTSGKTPSKQSPVASEEDGIVSVPIYRKQLLGDIQVGNGRQSFEYAALLTIAGIVESQLHNGEYSSGIVHDTIETEYEGHRVQVRLGEHVDYTS